MKGSEMSYRFVHSPDFVLVVWSDIDWVLIEEVINTSPMIFRRIHRDVQVFHVPATEVAARKYDIGSLEPEVSVVFKITVDIVVKDRLKCVWKRSVHILGFHKYLSGLTFWKDGIKISSRGPR